MTPALLDAAGVPPPLAGRLRARSTARTPRRWTRSRRKPGRPPRRCRRCSLGGTGGRRPGSPGGGRPAARGARHRRQRRGGGRRDPRPRAVAARHPRPGRVPRLPLPYRRRLHPLRARRAPASSARGGRYLSPGERAGHRHDALSRTRCCAAPRPRRRGRASSCPLGSPDAPARGAARRGLRHRGRAVGRPTRRSGSAARISCATAGRALGDAGSGESGAWRMSP